MSNTPEPPTSATPHSGKALAGAPGAGNPGSASAAPANLEQDATIVSPAHSVKPDKYPVGLTARELAHALRGEVLGHFLLEEYIGGGGMGVVFKALDAKLNRTVAVKVLASQRLSGEDLDRRFEVEAQSAARLDHPNIARVFESGVERGLPYIVFEYIEGVNLRDAVAARGPLPLAQALHCTYQAALALNHAQEREVIHRDIKPSNILLTPEGDAKLIDMGLARLKQASDQVELTATGMTLGTFDYLSPEQANDPRDADVRSDIYSLGCTLYFMLVGHAPFSEGTVSQKLIKHQNQLPPDVRQFRRDVPESVSGLIRAMLEKSPADRPQSPAEVAAILSGILQEMGVAVAQLPAPLVWSSASDESLIWKTWFPWAVAALVILIAIPLVDRGLRSDAPQPEFAPLAVPPPAEAAENQVPPPAVEAVAPPIRATDTDTVGGQLSNDTSATPLDLFGGGSLGEVSLDNLSFESPSPLNDADWPVGHSEFRLNSLGDDGLSFGFGPADASAPSTAIEFQEPPAGNGGQPSEAEDRAESGTVVD